MEEARQQQQKEEGTLLITTVTLPVLVVGPNVYRAVANMSTAEPRCVT